MSEPRLRERRWDFYVRDMIDACETVRDAVDEVGYAAVRANDITYAGTLFSLAIMGEAATNIPAHVREAHPNIQWRAIIGARNHIIHGYWKINHGIIRSIVEDDIPALLPRLRALLAA